MSGRQLSAGSSRARLAVRLATTSTPAPASLSATICKTRSLRRGCETKGAVAENAGGGAGAGAGASPEEKRARLVEARVRFLCSSAATALVERNLPESTYQHIVLPPCCSDRESYPLRFAFKTSTNLSVDGGYTVVAAVKLQLQPSGDCADESETVRYDVAARLAHDRNLVAGTRLFAAASAVAATAAPDGESKCGCRWRLLITNRTYDLSFVRTYATLDGAAAAAVAILPELRMCDECGKIAGRGEYVDPATFWAEHPWSVDKEQLRPLPNEDAGVGVGSDVVLCHGCVGSVAFSAPANAAAAPNSADAEKKVCGICQFPTRLGWRSQCNHHFHKKCVRLHNEFGADLDCPLCRRDDALDLDI